MAVLTGIVLYAVPPSRLVLGTRFVVPGLELLLLIPLIGVNPRRFRRQTTLSRALSLAVVGVRYGQPVLAGSAHQRAAVGNADNGKELLLAAFQVWVTNIIVFGLGYWELDRGGP